MAKKKRKSFQKVLIKQVKRSGAYEFLSGAFAQAFGQLLGDALEIAVKKASRIGKRSAGARKHRRAPELQHA